MVQTISGKPNKFIFIGTFSKVNHTFVADAPDGINDFVFDVENGICYVETSQKFYYDEETGNLYLIKED